MRTREFPMCCGAKIITNFGGAGGYLLEGLYGTKYKTQEQIENYLERQEQVYNNYAMLVCTTNNKQTRANKALRARGWKRTLWNKGLHENTKVALWYKLMIKE